MKREKICDLRNFMRTLLFLELIAAVTFFLYLFLRNGFGINLWISLVIIYHT